jgi:hypothetical protein
MRFALPVLRLLNAVMFKFKPDVTAEHKAAFVRELRKLKDLPSVKDNRLLVGGPSITDPIERSKGFEFALLSFHQDRAALEAYQASKEHHWYKMIKKENYVFIPANSTQGHKHLYVPLQRGSFQVRFRGQGRGRVYVQLWPGLRTERISWQ